VLPAGGLPAIGQTVPLSLNAFGTTLESPDLPPPLPTLNFIGSIALKVLTGGTDSVRLRTVDFSMEAAHPRFGRITLQQPDPAATPESLLQLGPGGLAMTMLLSFTITFERDGDSAGPFTYTTLDPAKLTAPLSSFPPPAQGTNPDGSPTGGQLYQVQAPVSLGTVDAAGPREKFQLRGMNVNVGQLAA
jgi:hypothetical protein